VNSVSNQQFVSQPAIEAFDEGILNGFARRDATPFDQGAMRPPKYRFHSMALFPALPPEAYGEIDILRAAPRNVSSLPTTNEEKQDEKWSPSAS
jgi:hypothetical protein